MTADERKRELRAAVEAMARKFEADIPRESLTYQLQLVWAIVDGLVDECARASEERGLQVTEQSLAELGPIGASIMAAEDQAVIAAYRVAAKRKEEEGELEIDDTAGVSIGEDGSGAYVQAWLWVSKAEAGICTRCGTPGLECLWDGLCKTCEGKELAESKEDK
jgi:hypothetical protein